MLNHVVTLVVWIGVTIAVFHLFAIDAAFFLSSAGFIGAAVAIGGQHKVNDYLTGLSVLFEDRYGVGDELVVDVGGGERVHAVVDNIGLVTTRLRDETSTLHVPNAQLTVVRNLSQEASAATVRLRVPDVEGPDATRWAAEALRGLAGSEQLTDVVFVGDLAAERGADGRVDVAVKTVRPLDERATSLLVERAERVLGVTRMSGQTASRVRARAARWRRMARRSSSDRPPQTPESWFVDSAKSRQSTRASHSTQTCFAFSIWTRARPVVPTGKNSSGSVSRQSA